MTTEEAKALLAAFYEKKKKRNLFWFFRTRDTTITITLTELLEPWQKEANLALPPSIQLENVSINKQGMIFSNRIIAWKDIFLTAVIEERIYKGRGEVDELYYFVAACLLNGEVAEAAVPDIKKHSNLLGHFIEQYKGSA